MNNSFSNNILPQNHEMWKTHLVIGYYIILGIIQTLWLNPTAFPPIALRLSMIVLPVAPLFFKKEFVPFVYIFFITLRLYLSTDYSYLPDIYSVKLYIYLLLILLLFHNSFSRIHMEGKKLLFLIFLLYCVIIDFINNGDVGNGAIFYLLALLLLPFLNSRESVEIAIVGYVSVNIILSIYYYLLYDQFLYSWNTQEYLERSGWADPNYFSIHLGIGFMFCQALFFGIIKTQYIKIWKPILIIGSFSIFLAAVMTGSRAGLLSILIITFLSMLTSQKSFKYNLIPFIIIPIAIYSVFKSEYARLILYRIFEEGNLETAGERTTIWAHVLSSFDLHGFSSFLFGGGWMHRLELTNGMDTHNEIIGILCDYGVIGLLLFITLFVITCFNPVYKTFKFNIYIPIVYLVLIMLSLSPSQYPLMPIYIAWLLSSNKLFTVNTENFTNSTI